MKSENSHQTFAQAYVRGLRDLLEHGHDVPPIEDPTSVASKFGQVPRRTTELLGYSFEVRDPRSCLALSSARSLRLPFCFGLFLWTMAGSDNAEWISYYNSRAHDFSDDGIYITAAFGKRLFGLPATGDQLDAIAKRLSGDPQSRRTVATIALPDDNVRRSRDYPCAIALQFFLREDHLHAITYMRSQSAAMVLPYDAFLFMAMQCWMASRLGVAPGPYRHVAGSFHIYEDEVQIAREVLQAGADPARIGPMPSPEANLDRLLAFEREVRAATIARATSTIHKLIGAEIGAHDDDSFFAQARRILLLHAARTLKAPALIESLIAELPSEIQCIIDPAVL
jgi:thymidylate synthase